MRLKCPVPRKNPITASTSPVNRLADSEPEISVNASVQKKVVNEITIAEKKFIKFEQIYNFTTDYQL